MRRAEHFEKDIENLVGSELELAWFTKNRISFIFADGKMLVIDSPSPLHATMYQLYKTENNG